jgi:hypothetical protein
VLPVDLNQVEKPIRNDRGVALRRGRSTQTAAAHGSATHLHHDRGLVTAGRQKSLWAVLLSRSWENSGSIKWKVAPKP